jgi:methylthioribose-1-phosphate isomerase
MMVQKKRKQASETKGASKKQKQDGQKAVSKDIKVPIDEGFRENGKHALPNRQDTSQPSILEICNGNWLANS